jgi:hypothetical protein
VSSNIRIHRICQLCNRDFIAKTTVTKFCGDDCAKRAYKKRLREQKVGKSNDETFLIKAKPIDDLKAKEYLSIADVCKLIGVSRTTFWRVSKAKSLPILQFGGRKIIAKKDLDKIFQSI